MSHHTSDQPPPLPPRSPRPPIAGYNTSSQYSVASFPPPPPGPPPRTSAVSSNPIDPPPPLPPRPAGYETRTPSNPPAPFVHPPSTGHSSVSPNSQATLDLPLPPPPPPPLGPPPPYSASAVDVCLSPPNQPHPEKVTGANTTHSPLTSPVSGLSSPTSFPPPPPGPPPKLSPHPSPGIPQYSYNPSHPSSPNGPSSGIPTSQLPYEPVKHQANPLGISETHNNGLQKPISPGDKPGAYQPASVVQTPPDASTSHSEKPSAEAHGASTPSSGVPLNQTVNLNTVAPDITSGTISLEVSPPPQHRPLESTFQSLNLSSTPPIPPKTPLAPGSSQSYFSQPASPAPGTVPGHNRSGYKAYTPPNHESSSKTTSPPPASQQPPANHPSPQQNVVPRAVTSCIDTPATFTTDWYQHPEATDFTICSRCYADHIHRSVFQPEFQHTRPADAKARVCRFSKPRMKDHLWKTALATCSLREAVAWMRTRAAIPDCRGTEGVRGSSGAGIKWFAPRDGSIPHFIACEACSEDKLRTNRFATRFAAYAQPQPADDIWACDLATPFVEKEYEEAAARDDWAGFAARTKARIAMPPCPGALVGVVAQGRNWYGPKVGPRALVLCAACFYDQILHTAEEGKWEIAQGLARSADVKVRCAHAMFNIRVLIAQANQEKNWALFWNTVARLEREKTCEPDGIVDGVWYTLPSNPGGFGVCSACYIAIMESLGVARFWVRKHDVPPGAKFICCFSVGHARLRRYAPKLIEMYYTLDPTTLEECASLYAGVPLCSRDEETSGLCWYGWRGCTICPECYLDFARYSPLAKTMELHDAPLANKTMCEMYSRRMRTLYTECGNTNLPNPKPLLDYSMQRRQVYMETIPQIRMIMSQQKMAQQRLKAVDLQSSHHARLGHFQDMTYGSAYKYSAAGVGSGFSNYNALQGAAYRQQANNLAADLGTSNVSLAVGQLEQRWRAVE
ncbi:hypothetical protein F4803DRAFT_523611 [Xylaria telfairii]|nr:hypothetical protein F4803DRAFT_523611 [Xylaria telfairii]